MAMLSVRRAFASAQPCLHDAATRRAPARVTLLPLFNGAVTRLGQAGIARTWMTVRVPEVRFASVSAPPSASNEDVEYHARADAALHWLETEFGSVEDCADDIEVSLSQGVLTLEMGDARGTIVVNKQSAARQIWSSSPRAGPRRYAFDAATRTWRSTRDHAELAADLGKEIQAHLPAWRGFSGPLHG